MRLYYTFGVYDAKDYEFEVINGVVANYLSTITGFSRDDIMQHFDLFTDIFQPQIYEHYEEHAKSEFEKSIDTQGRSIVSFLKHKETSKKQRQAFLKREALKKKEMVE